MNLYFCQTPLVFSKKIEISAGNQYFSAPMLFRLTRMELLLIFFKSLLKLSNELVASMLNWFPYVRVIAE